jgi:hypothetical protein
MVKRLCGILFFALVYGCFFGPVTGYGQDLEVPEIGVEKKPNLESRVSRLESKISDHATKGATVMLFGAFCALWAQNTRRNAWLWFFMGTFFTIVTVLVLLYKNSEDRQKAAVT